MVFCLQYVRMTADSPPSSLTFADSSEVREYLVEALKLDLVGPGAGHDLADERLPGWRRPSSWYLTGFLIPSETPFEDRSDLDEDESLDEVPEIAGLSEESAEERRAAKKGFFPSSMGLSFLVSEQTESLTVTVRWGDYEAGEVEDADGKPVAVWQRTAEKRTVDVTLSDPPDRRVPESGGLRLHVVSRQVDGQRLAGLPRGTRSVSVFLVNSRPPVPGNPGGVGVVDRAYAFQAELEITCNESFVPRPDPRGMAAAEWDDRVADLHYTDTPEYAVGHGVSAEWEVVDGYCRLLRTAWIPSATVAKTEPVKIPDVELSMEALGDLADGEAASEALNPLVSHYRPGSMRSGTGSERTMATVGRPQRNCCVSLA